MPLQDIRIVIQQLATPFDALKKVGVIHTDVKTNNIMLVDQTIKPLQVKLIDFDMSVFTKDAKSIRDNQVLRYKAPELIFGLSYSEALDIWSLGCVMSEMVFKCKLFPGAGEDEVVSNSV
nr:homeodomain-interacting protein kinase 1-like [Nothobranchius furzeri]